MDIGDWLLVKCQRRLVDDGLELRKGKSGEVVFM